MGNEPHFGSLSPIKKQANHVKYIFKKHDKLLVFYSCNKILNQAWSASTEKQTHQEKMQGKVQKHC